MKTIILVFLLILSFSILGFILNKAKIYSLSKRSKRMNKSQKRKKTLEQNPKRIAYNLNYIFFLKSNVW